MPAYYVRSIEQQVLHGESQTRNISFFVKVSRTFHDKGGVVNLGHFIIIILDITLRKRIALLYSVGMMRKKLADTECSW